MYTHYGHFGTIPTGTLHNLEDSVKKHTCENTILKVVTKVQNTNKQKLLLSNTTDISF